jgi:hypothetical protein
MVADMAVRTPRRRGPSSTVLTVVLLTLLVVLALHGIVMGVHHIPDAGCATCIAAIVTIMIGLVAALMMMGPVMLLDPSSGDAAVVALDPGVSGSRHPPRTGTVLRL